MESKPAIFNHPDFGKIRTAGTSEQPLFCLADVCKALDLDNPSYIKKRLDAKGVFSNYTKTGRGQRTLLFINEPNLYKCIFQSRKKEAQRFQDWIFEEVLPAIRETGSYDPMENADWDGFEKWFVGEASKTPDDPMSRAIINLFKGM